MSRPVVVVVMRTAVAGFEGPPLSAQAASATPIAMRRI
jgi:hypothetical protein